MARKWELLTVRVQDGVKEDYAKLANVLDDGWEPFSATRTTNDLEYHLRRPVVHLYRDEIVQILDGK